MGYDAACTLRLDGTSARGTAWLEHRHLVFRGERRLSIPLAKISSATASGGVLTVRFERRTAEFDIGEAAARWAGRITNPPSLLDKLEVKPGMRVLMDGVRDPGFRSELKARAVRLVPAAAGGAHLLFFAANRRASLAKLASLKARILPNGAIWVIRPKGQAAITEADTMAAGKRAGLVDVKVVSFSDTLTAEKFVIPLSSRPKPAR